MRYNAVIFFSFIFDVVPFIWFKNKYLSCRASGLFIANLRYSNEVTWAIYWNDAMRWCFYCIRHFLFILKYLKGKMAHTHVDKSGSFVRNLMSLNRLHHNDIRLDRSAVKSMLEWEGNFEPIITGIIHKMSHHLKWIIISNCTHHNGKRCHKLLAM